MVMFYALYVRFTLCAFLSHDEDFSMEILRFYMGAFIVSIFR